MRRSLVTLPTLLVTLACGASIALASGRAVLNDCTDDERMSKTYSQSDYRSALSQLSADTDQYGNCRDVIRQAMLAAAAGAAKPAKRAKGSKPGAPAPGDTSGVIGSEPAVTQLSSATPAEQTAVNRARSDASAPFTSDDAGVDPAKVGRVPGVSQVSSLPTPLVVLLALLCAGLLALSAARIRGLVHARRG